MTFELKKLTHEGIDSALSKAERYRLLNEPAEAASICPTSWLSIPRINTPS